MAKLRVASVPISLDGFGAGPDQSLENPLGFGGAQLHAWAFPTRTIRRIVLRADGGTTGLDDDFVARGFEDVGAWILGRNTFGPVRGPSPEEGWRGWWGEDPPCHVPVFVLTHYTRPPLAMQGETTFHFVTGGIHEALERAREVARGRDARLGGGPATIRQYLREGLVDELHPAIAPVLIGAGERLFEEVDLRALGYACARHVSTRSATHVVLARSPGP